MPARIDHVIVAAADLGQLESVFTRMGFQVVGGGQHPQLGTRNRIIVLGEGYIELLAIADAEAVSPGVRARINDAPGWIGFALQSDDMVAEVEEMRSRGADVYGPKDGRLVSPNGNERSWRTVTVGGDDLFLAAEPVPFLIQHKSSGAQHQRELAGADNIGPHPNGAYRLQSVILAVASLEDAERAFARDVGLNAVGTEDVISTLDAEALVLPLADASEQIVLARPLGEGPVHDRLNSAGQGICCVAVAVHSIAATREYLQRSGIVFQQWEDGLLIPVAASNGAPLAFVEASDH